jgi:hypothetical protein
MFTRLYGLFSSLSIILLILFPFSTLKGQEVVDTLITDNGTMIIYANRTWEYIEDRDFDGILNPIIHEYLNTDSAMNFSYPWDQDKCYAADRSNDLMRLKDTLWICAIDSNESFVIPHPGRVTSRYGWRKGRYHNGIDISLNTGDTVVSAFSGKVRYARYNEGGFGNLVVVRHFNGLETFYAHLSKHLVVPNQEVNAGDPIGLGGNSGRSFGSHLHFEIRFYDAPMDPEVVIDFENQRLKSENLFIHKGLFRPGASANSTATASASISSGDVTYHKVRSGDTLGHLARKYRTSVNTLCRLNGIKPTTTLHIGQQLRVR